MASAIKYRISMSVPQMKHILSVILSTPSSDDDTGLITSLQKAILKAEVGLTKPSHVSIAKQSIDTELGFTPIDPQSMSVLLETYKSNPSLLTPARMAQVQHHRYINDMMSAEEEAQYEQGAPES